MVDDGRAAAEAVIEAIDERRRSQIATPARGHPRGAAGHRRRCLGLQRQDHRVRLVGIANWKAYVALYAMAGHGRWPLPRRIDARPFSGSTKDGFHRPVRAKAT